MILTHKVWENVGRASVEEGNPVALVLVNGTYQTFPDLFFWGPKLKFYVMTCLHRLIGVAEHVF